jgi:hypothetical protein
VTAASKASSVLQRQQLIVVTNGLMTKWNETQSNLAIKPKGLNFDAIAADYQTDR